MSRRVAFGLLLLLAALLPVRVEASRTSVWESNLPASFSVARTEAASALASLAPAAADDVDAAELPPFNLGDVVLADTAEADAERFNLGPLTLVDLNLLRGPPPSYPETRVGSFELLPPFRVGASPTLSLWGRQACGFSCGEVASDSREDPWGLLSEKELNDRFFSDLANLPRDVAYAKDRERRALSAYQDELQGQRKSTIGHLWDEFTGSAESKYQDYRNAPGVVRDAVRRAWTTRDGRAVSSDLVAAGGDYGRQIADRGYEVLGDIHGKGGETLTEGLQLYGEGKAIEFGLGAIGAVGAKRGPKPQGSGPHNMTIEDVAKQVEARGDKVVAGGGRAYPPEAIIPTPGGYKGTRRPDILAQRPDGTLYGINAGKIEKSGLPVKRERKAIEDLEGPGGLEMHFVPFGP